MKLVKRFAFVGLAAFMLITLVACGGGGGGAAGGGGGAVSLEPEGDGFAFKTKTLTAKAGDQMSVSFKNSSTANQHNWVLVKGGDDVANKVDDAGAAAADKGYIPDDPNILAHTKLLNAGESDSASFTAPAAGTYTYLCTVPGHYAAGMKGTLTVQ